MKTVFESDSQQLVANEIGKIGTDRSQYRFSGDKNNKIAAIEIEIAGKVFVNTAIHVRISSYFLDSSFP